VIDDLNQFNPLKRFVLARDGIELGSFDKNQVEIMEADGDLRPTDHIYKESANGGKWVLLFKHTPSSDFFQHLEWKEYDKLVKQEQKKAQSFLLQFLSQAGEEQDPSVIKEAKKRADEYQDLLIYLAGMKKREVEERKVRDRVLQEEEIEQEKNDERDEDLASLGLNDDEVFQVERHESWLTGSMKGTKDLQTYQEFLSDKYWSKRFEAYWPDITETQKKDLWNIFKNISFSDEDIWFLARYLTVTDEAEHPSIIISFSKADGAFCPLSFAGPKPRNKEEDRSQLLKLVKSRDKKGVNSVLSELKKLISSSKRYDDFLDFEDSEFSDLLLTFTSHDVFERRETIWVALRSLNSDDQDLRRICEDIYKSYDEDPLGSPGNILRSFLYSRQLLHSP